MLILGSDVPFVSPKGDLALRHLPTQQHTYTDRHVSPSGGDACHKMDTKGKNIQNLTDTYVHQVEVMDTNEKNIQNFSTLKT